MEKIGLLTRETIVEELKQKAKEAEGCFFIGFNKVDAFSFNHLRNSLKTSKAQVFVAKNSLFKRAFQELERQNAESFLEAETGIVFVYDKDIVRPCKILADFSKETEGLRLKGGVIKGKEISSKELGTLAKLPSKEVLLGWAVSAIASPITGFLACANQIILKFVWVLEEIKKCKLTQAEKPQANSEKHSA